MVVEFDVGRGGAAIESEPEIFDKSDRDVMLRFVQSLLSLSVLLKYLCSRPSVGDEDGDVELKRLLCHLAFARPMTFLTQGPCVPSRYRHVRRCIWFTTICMIPCSYAQNIWLHHIQAEDSLNNQTTCWDGIARKSRRSIVRFVVHVLDYRIRKAQLQSSTQARLRCRDIHKDRLGIK